MCKKSELKEMENTEKINGCKVKYFIGKTKQEVENKLWKYVHKNKTNISLLVCRKKNKNRFIYALWY
jgi:hypothetical protein